MATEKMLQKRADKIEQILSVATEVFSEKGFHGALTDEIAERAGVRKLSLYYYVGDKEALYKAVWKRLEEQFSPALFFLYNKEESAEKNLERMIRGVAEIAENIPVHSMALRELFAGGENYPENLVRDIEIYFDRFSMICKELKGDSKDMDVPPAIIAWMVYAFLVYWVVTIPPMMKYEGPQIEVLREIGMGTNEKIIQMVKKLVLRMLNVTSQE
jgi:AcrR family transcriptional regulator